jgi:hypothetical protein
MIFPAFYTLAARRASTGFRGDGGKAIKCRLSVTATASKGHSMILYGQPGRRGQKLDGSRGFLLEQLKTSPKYIILMIRE